RTGEFGERPGRVEADRPAVLPAELPAHQGHALGLVDQLVILGNRLHRTTVTSRRSRLGRSCACSEARSGYARITAPSSARSTVDVLEVQAPVLALDLERGITLGAVDLR